MDTHVLILKLTNKLDLRRSEKYQHQQLHGGSFLVSHIQDYFEYTLKKHNENVGDPSIRVYVNRIENAKTFNIKTGYYLELLTPETMKLLGRTENKVTKDKNGENVPHLEITELVLVHFNIVNNDYQHDLKAFYKFVPNRPFGSLLEISPRNHIHLKHLNLNLKQLECGLTLIIR